MDDNEEAEEDEDDDEGYSEEEEDEGKNSEDHRMMDGDEGGMPLPDDDDVEVYSPEQTGMEDFERVSSLNCKDHFHIHGKFTIEPLGT